jgi:hypothetical protein
MTFDKIVEQMATDFIPATIRDQPIAVLQKRHVAESDPMERLSTIGGITGKIDNNRV